MKNQFYEENYMKQKDTVKSVALQVFTLLNFHKKYLKLIESNFVGYQLILLDIPVNKVLENNNQNSKLKETY